MMKIYSAWLTLWKAGGTLAQTTGSAALIALFAIDWPDDPAAMDVNGWIVFACVLLPAAWRALENWRKNGGYNGRPLWEWKALVPGWIRTPMVLALTVAALGCATARTDATITQVYQDGTTETVEFSTRGIVTWGSSQDLQRGDMGHFWEADGSGQFTAGGSATGQVAEEPDIRPIIDLLNTEVLP